MKLLDKQDREQFENEDYDDDKVVWDVLDQLWRFEASGWGEGIRNYNLTDRPHSTRETSTNKEIAKMERDGSMKKWREFFETHPLGKLYAWIWEEDFWDFDEEDEPYLLPITVSEYGIHHWMWEHSKFKSEGGSPGGNGLKEAAPNSYICIYWMGRAFDIF